MNVEVIDYTKHAVVRHTQSRQCANASPYSQPDQLKTKHFYVHDARNESNSSAASAGSPDLSEGNVPQVFQLKQSTHSSERSAFGVSLYFKITSLMTLMMRWVLTPCLHPKSETTS